MKRGISFYLLIILALAALGVLIYLLAPGSVPETPPVVLATLPAQDSSGVPAASDSPGVRVISVDPDTVQTVIGMLARADSYSRTLTAQNFWNGGSATTEIEVRVRGENVRLTIRGDGSDAEKNVLIRGAEEWIWYSDGGGVWHGSAKEGDADAYQTLLTYEDVLSLDKSAISDAGYTVYNGENCIFVRYTAGELGYEHFCYVSDATGLLMGTETYDGDMLVYSLRSSVPDISTPSDDIFAIP